MKSDDSQPRRPLPSHTARSAFPSTDHTLKTETRRIYWWSIFPVFSLLPLPVVVISQYAQGDLLWAILGVVIFINFGTALLYYYDKLCAESRTWRVGERTLQLAALIGGWPAAFVAQQFLRHKVAKPAFQFQFWTIVLVYQIVLLDASRGFVWWIRFTRG